MTVNKSHMVVADGQTTVTFLLSPSQSGGILEDWKRLKVMVGKEPQIIIDKVYKGDETR